jgi:hypothetical protein
MFAIEAGRIRDGPGGGLVRSSEGTHRDVGADLSTLRDKNIEI